MASENSETFHFRRLLLNLSDKINFKRIDNCVALSNGSSPTYRKTKKCRTKTINVKYLL